MPGAHSTLINSCKSRRAYYQYRQLPGLPRRESRARSPRPCRAQNRRYQLPGDELMQPYRKLTKLVTCTDVSQLRGSDRESRSSELAQKGCRSDWLKIGRTLANALDEIIKFSVAALGFVDLQLAIRQLSDIQL